MASPDDNTAVIRMKREFQSFIGSQKDISASHNTLSFDMDTSNMSATSDHMQPVSMQRIIDKEKEERIRQAELVKAKAENTRIKAQLNTEMTNRKRIIIEHEKEVQALKQEIQLQLDKQGNVKQKFYSIAAQKDTVQEELAATRKTLDTIKSTYEQRLSTLQKEKLKTEAEYAESEQSSRKHIMELKNESMRRETELQICKSEMAELRNQLAGAQKKNTSANQVLQELEDFRMRAMDAEHKVKVLEEKLGRVDEDMMVGKSLKSQLDRLPELEKENRQLREENKYCKDTQENIFLLKEEAESAKRKLERMEQRRTELEAMSVKYEELLKTVRKYELEEKSGNRKSMSPLAMSRQLASIQNTNLLLMDKQGQLKASAHSLEERVRISETASNALKEQLIQEQQRALQRTELIKRLQRKLLLVTKERDSSRQILDSYDSESTVNIAAISQQRLRQLEQINESYHRQMEDLEQNLNKTTEDLAEAKTRAYISEGQVGRDSSSVSVTSEADQKTIVELTAKLADIEKRLEAVTEEKEILEARMEQRHLQGDYDPTKTKVLHFRMNPAAEAQKARGLEVARLTAENEKLKERLKLLEESGGKLEDLTMQVEQNVQQPSSSKEVQDMKAQLTSAELKNKRLFEAFKRKSREFRESCYQLLGYRIDIPTDNQYKLMNMYSESPEDCLLFKQSEDGEMQLLGTDYSASQMEKVQFYLEQGHSIPAFLSSLTLDLFSRQTMMQ